MPRRFLIFCAFLALPALMLPQSVSAATPASNSSAMSDVQKQVRNPANAVVGLWITSGGKSHVKIYRGENGLYYGKIVWLKQPSYPADYDNQKLAGQPKVDVNNPDPSLRDRPVLGMVVLTDFKYYAPDNDWRNGHCYDPQKGETYDCKMWLKPDTNGQTLKVRGFVWIFHRTETWHRYNKPEPTHKAATPTTAPAPATTMSPMSFTASNPVQSMHKAAAPSTAMQDGSPAMNRKTRGKNDDSSRGKSR